MRLFPEYSHDNAMVWVSPAHYAEIDWESGRSLVVKQRRQPAIPACVAAEAKSERKKLPRVEEEGAE